MATLYKTDGTVTQVTPRNGVEFELEELRGYIGGGWLDATRLTERLHMYVDDNSVGTMPVNDNATHCLYEHRPEVRGKWVICGDALVCDISETGDE